MGIKFITDSASDMGVNTPEGLRVLPLTVRFDDTEYLDCVNLSHTEFYEKLIESDVLPTTSQIAPFDFENAIKEAHKNGDIAIIVTISSKLSGTYQSACIAASEFEKDVYVIDSESAAIGERILIEAGMNMAAQGMDAENIVETLNNIKHDIRVIALLDTLEYLKKGGRISKTVAFAGNVLNLKPVVAIVNGEVAFQGTARGSKQGNNLLIQHIEKSGGIDFSMPLSLGYTGLSDKLIQKYITDSEHIWKDHRSSLPIVTLGGAIGTHVGPGAIAVAFFANNK